MRNVRDLLTEGGWPVVFDVGVSEPTHPYHNELNKGKLLGFVEGDVIQIRSMDMLKIIGERRYDAMIVGSDCVEERFSPQFVELMRLPLGRQWNAPRPRLELVALQSSSVQDVADIQPGSIVMTERPRITKSYFESFGRGTINEGLDVDPEFKQRLLEAESVGIREILGDGPAQLDSYYPDDYFLAMVSETGNTVRDYDLKVISVIRDIDTLLITREDVLNDPTKREAVRQLVFDLENTYPKLKREHESGPPSKERDIL